MLEREKKRKREKEREKEVQKATGNNRTYTSLVKLQHWFPSLRWKTCICSERAARGQNTLMIMMISVMLL